MAAYTRIFDPLGGARAPKSAARSPRQACRILPLHGEAHAITAFGSACMLCMQAESEALLGGCETQGLPNLRFCNTSHTKTSFLYENVAKVPRPDHAGFTKDQNQGEGGKNRLGGPWGTLGAFWAFPRRSEPPLELSKASLGVIFAPKCRPSASGRVPESDFGMIFASRDMKLYGFP